VERVMGVEPT